MSLLLLHQEKTCEKIIPYGMSSYPVQKWYFHTPGYVIIPTIVISYHTGMSSYQIMSFYTVKVSIHICTCHCILVLLHTKTCHFILATAWFIRKRIVSYLHTWFQMKCVWPSALYLRLLTTQPEITRHPLGCFFAMYCVAQCSCPPTEWLWLALTAPKCQASDALSAGIQAWSHLVYE